MAVTMSSLLVTGLILIGVITGPSYGMQVLAEGSMARERVDAIYLRCDVTNLDQEDEIVRVTWRHNDTLRHGAWSDIFTVDLTNDVPAYFFFSHWSGRGHYNPISLATVVLSSPYVTRYSAGIYRCDVETANTHGYAQAFVDVYYGPGTSIAISPGGRVQKTEGEELLLSCHAQCNPSCSYRWYKSGRRLSTSSTLRMTSVSRHDGGLYACQARNEAGRSIKPLEIRVHYPPDILELTKMMAPKSKMNGSSSISQNMNKKDEKKEIVLQCRIQAWPEPEIHWFKGSTRLQNSTRPTTTTNIVTWLVDLEHKTSRLKIENATCLDNGVYSCKAHNSIGEVTTRDINIAQDCPPSEIFDSELCPLVFGGRTLSRRQQQQQQQQRRRERFIEIEKKFGEEVTIQFCLTGYPIPAVHVSREGGGHPFKYAREMHVNESGIACNDETKVCVAEFSFVLTSPLQYGRYEVKVVNRLRSFTKMYHIVSRQPPLPPKNVAMTAITSTSVCVSWNPGFNGGAEQIFNLTYTRFDSNSEGRNEDTKTEAKSVTLQKIQNSWIATNVRDMFISSIINPHSNSKRDAQRTYRSTRNRVQKTRSPNRNEVNARKDKTIRNARSSSTSVSTCISDLMPSSVYSIKIESSNAYGKSSQTPDVFKFKTLDTPTTTTTTITTSLPPPPPPPSSPPTPSQSPPSQLHRQQQPTGISIKPPRKSTSKSAFLGATPNYASTTNRNTRISKKTFGHAHRGGQGGFEQLPIHDDGQVKDEPIQTEFPYNSDKVKLKPTPFNEIPNHALRPLEDDHFWNSDEDDNHNYNNNNNNNNNNMNDKAIDIQNRYDGESNDDTDEYDDDNFDDFNNEFDDDDFDSEENRLFRMLFPYFQSVLFNDNNNNINQDITIDNRDTLSLSHTNAPQGPFEVGRYFKKYALIEKQKHIPIPLDTSFPFNDTRLLHHTGNSHRKITSTQAADISISTLASPENDSYDSWIISSISIGSVIIAVFAIASVILKLIFKRRRWDFRKRRSQNSTTSLSPQTHRGCSSTPPESTPPHQSQSSMTPSSRMRSNPNSHSPGSSCQTVTIPNSGIRHCPQTKATNQTSNYSNTNTITNNPHSKHLSSINTRPRLSTPKAHRKDRQKCAYANSNSNSNTPSTISASSAQEPTVAAPTSTTTTTTTANHPPYSNPHSYKTLTIPGISVNNQRISSPSYLELCMGSSSSCESERNHHHHNHHPTTQPSPHENQDINSTKNSNLNLNLDNHMTRRSSYSSIIIADDVIGNSDHLDTTSKWNSYLDLCEALSVKSGSRSPSNIYDPLDISDKWSIRSVASYVSPNTPELARKVLEGNHIHNIKNYSHNALREQRSPMEIKKSVLNKKKKLCGELSESDNSSSYYEKCVSLTYDKDEMEKMKQSNVLNIKEMKPFSLSERLISTTSKVVEYMNEKNEKHPHNIMTSTSHRFNNQPRKDVENINVCDMDTIDNINSVYNEIEICANENEICVKSMKSLKQHKPPEAGKTIYHLPDKDKKGPPHFQNNDELTKDREKAKTSSTDALQNIKGTPKISNKQNHSTESSRSCKELRHADLSSSKAKSTKKYVRSASGHSVKPKAVEKLSGQDSVRNTCGHSVKPNIVEKLSGQDSVRNTNTSEHSVKPKVVEKLSGQDSASHYYSDIDTNDD